MLSFHRLPPDISLYPFSCFCYTHDRRLLKQILKRYFFDQYPSAVAALCLGIPSYCFNQLWQE